MRNNMHNILDNLQEDLMESVKENNLIKIFQKLDEIKSPLVCSGVGGSMPCAIFATKIFEEKKWITSCKELLAILQSNNKFNDYLLFSHSGKNDGIKKVLESRESSYLFTTRKSKIKKEVLINYTENIREKSFISIKNTFLPMAILLLYSKRNIKFPKVEKYSIVQTFQNIEILTDESTKTAAAYLESTAIEANIAPVIIHDKYSFCHGRHTTTHYQNNLIIYLISKKSLLDEMILNVLKEQKKQIVILNAEDEDFIQADFNLTFQALNLLIQIAEQKEIELCNIKYAPFAGKLYHYKLEDF